MEAFFSVRNLNPTTDIAAARFPFNQTPSPKGSQVLKFLPCLALVDPLDTEVNQSKLISLATTGSFHMILLIELKFL